MSGGAASGAEGIGAIPRDYGRARYYFLRIARQIWPHDGIGSAGVGVGVGVGGAYDSVGVGRGRGGREGVARDVREGREGREGREEKGVARTMSTKLWPGDGDDDARETCRSAPRQQLRSRSTSVGPCARPVGLRIHT